MFEGTDLRGFKDYSWLVPSVLWLCVVCVVGWVALNGLLYMFTGCYAVSFNPYSLRLKGVHLGNKIKIRSVRYVVWKHRLLFDTIEWIGDTGKRDSGESEPESKKNEKSADGQNVKLLTDRVARWLPSIAARLSNLTVVLDDTRICRGRISFALVKVESDGKSIGFEINLQNVMVDQRCIVENTALRTSAVIDTAMPFPLKDIHVDVVLRDVSVSVGTFMKTLHERKHGEVPDLFDYLQGTVINPPAEVCEPEQRDASNEWNLQEIISSYERKFDQFYQVSSAFDKIDILLDSSVFEDIPLTSNIVLVKATDAVRLQVSSASMIFSLSRSSFSEPGTKLLFDVDERPLKLSTFLSAVKVTLITQDPKTRKQYITQFCEVPNISLYGDSNLFTKKTCASKDGKVFANTVVKLVGHITSPMIDIDIEKLSLLISVDRNLKVIEDLLRHRLLKKPISLNEIYEKITRKGKLLEYFQNYLPHTELKITIEDPVYMVSNEQDSLVHQLSIISFKINSSRAFIKTEEKLYYSLLSQLEVIDWACFHQNKEQIVKQPVFCFDSMRLSVNTRIVPSLTLSATLDIETIDLNLTNLNTLIVINNTIRKRLMKLLYVEDTYFTGIFETLEKGLKEKIEHLQNHQTEVSPVQFEDILFNDLPYFFQYISLSIKGFNALVGARSVFIERKDYINPNFETVHDFVSGDMRKASFCFDEFRILFAKVNEPSTLDENSSSSAKITFESIASDDRGLGSIPMDSSDQQPGPWSLDLELLNYESKLCSETKTDSFTLVWKPVLKLPSLKAFIQPDHKTKHVKASVQISRVDTFWSLMTSFLFISSIYNLKMVFTTDLYPSRRQCLVTKHMKTIKSLKKNNLICCNLKALKDALEIEFTMDVFSSVMLLPNGVRTKFELAKVETTITDLNLLTMEGHYARLMVESPIIRNSWMRMICVVNYKIEADLLKAKENPDQTGIKLSNESWQWTIPHRFEMYKLFDNISTTFKSLKQMISSLLTESNKSVIHPKVTKFVAIPKIKLKSSRWVFSVEDDPFETELNLLLQIGLREQKIRLEKYAAFKKRVENEFIKSETKFLKKPATFTSGSVGRRKKLLRSHSTSSLRSIGLYDFDFSGVDGMAEQLKDEYNRLCQNISKSWIVRVKKHRSLMKNHFSKNFEFLWGNIDFVQLPPDFNKSVLDFTSAPSLMSLIIEGIDIDLSEPSFGIKGIPQFIYDVGKKVPLDTKYSIMIPLNLNANFSEIRCHLKDYPLPAVHFSKNMSNLEESTINLKCDLLVTEDMIHSEKELRTIYVPLVPSAHLEDSELPYSLLVPRTITAIKVYTDINLHITSPENARIVWGGSYSGAIQQAMKCFDNFSKPPIDPSPAVGFWDKIRNMFHARIHIRLPDSPFEVALKGAKNPYTIGGILSGYTIVFKDNVEIFCNKDDNPKKFLTVIAWEVSFAVPNFLAKALPVWNMPSENALFFADQDFTNIQDNAAFYYLFDPSNQLERDKNMSIMRKDYIEKCAIKLTGGMELSVGIMFERKIPGTKDRTLKLKPHHQFRLCNPVYIPVGEAHDSYFGFRSDFIHLSFELNSKAADAYNCMQLSPKAFKVFFRWWASFSGNLPVRKGPLFGDERFSAKFATHLYTISYRAEVCPLFICHITPGLEPKSLIDASSNIDIYGLKAKMSSFSMDLHQRKEVFHEYQEKLDITKRTTSLKFHEADVTTNDIDIRTLFGSFLAKEHAHRWKRHVDIFDEDSAWFDIEDFSEVGYSGLQSYIPKVSIKPLLFAPLFAYKKLAPYGDKYQVDLETLEPITPFDNSLYHNCNLKRYVVIPDRLVNDRIQVFNQEKATIEEQLSQTNIPNSKSLKERLDMLKKSLKQVNSLKDDIHTLNKAYKEADKDKSDSIDFYDNLSNPMFKYMKSSDRPGKRYANKFIVVSMLLKWNEEVRDIFLKYLHRISLLSELENVTKLKTIQTLDSLVDKSRQSITTVTEDSVEEIDLLKSDKEEVLMNPNYEEKNSDELLISFQDDLRSLAGDWEYTIFEKHHVQLIAPQIQLTTVSDPDACVLVTAPTIKVNSLCFDSNSTDNEYQSNLFMSRTGIILIKSNVFVFHKKDQEIQSRLLFDNFLYGTTHETSWRPWLGLELCFNAENIKENMLISNFTSVITYDHVLPFAKLPADLQHSKVLKNRITCNLPRIVIESNSARYLSLFNLVTNLLLYVEPESAKMKEEIKKLILGFNFEDLTNVREAITTLDKEIDMLTSVEKEYGYRRNLLDDADIVDMNCIRYDKIQAMMKMVMMMKVLTSASPRQTGDEDLIFIVANAREIILHMLDDNKKTFIDVAIADFCFQRMETSSGYNFNKMTVGMAQLINLSQDATLHDLLSPVDPKLHPGSEPFIKLEWEKDKAVGGIQVVKNVVTNLQDIKINVEQSTIEQIIAWVSPSSLSALIDESNHHEERDTTSASLASSKSTRSSSTFQNRNGINGNSAVDSGVDYLAQSPTEGLLPVDGMLNSEIETEEMIQRAKENLILENITINSFLMIISYQGTGAKRLINVTDFALNFPVIQFANQTMTILDLMMHLKKVIIKSLLRHTGKFIGNKLTTHRSIKRLRRATTSPLKQLNYYSHYTSVDELQTTLTSESESDTTSKNEDTFERKPGSAAGSASSQHTKQT